MKLTFKQFLQEEISLVNGKANITIQHYQAGSTKETISTYFRAQPYTTKLRGVDAEVYSLLNYVTSETSSDILKALKASNVSEVQLDNFMKQVKSSVSIFVKRVKPDVIIYPRSSSPFLTRFMDEVTSAYPSAEVLSDRFVKSALDAEDVEPLLNTAHPDWKKFSEEHPDQVKLLRQNLKSQLKRGPLELKKLYKPYLKFIKNFIELRDAYEVLEKVMDRSVLVVDDILSSGATMAEMVRQLAELEPSKLVGLTLFKHTTQPK